MRFGTRRMAGEDVIGTVSWEACCTKGLPTVRTALSARREISSHTGERSGGVREANRHQTRSLNGRDRDESR